MCHRTWSQRNPVGGRFRLIEASCLLLLVIGILLPAVKPAGTAAVAMSESDATCRLKNGIKHVIYIQFDNVHLMRDNPNVPSDLEQMPHLLNFIESNGVMLSNNHTPLIAHTGTNILTSLTGVYPDRHGVAVSNSYRYFNPDGTSSPASAFAYWTDPLYDPSNPAPTDTTYNMLNELGVNAPAPWVPYTRAGCNVGGVGAANMVLENIGADIPTVFGADSPEASEVKANPAQASADFVGISIHCALNSPLCSAEHSGKPDLLPDEPGGYQGYQALFGHKYVVSQISPDGPLTDLDGHIIQDSQGHIGFPGFDGMSASVSLAYVAAMQEHGVPITYAYISDVHDKHPGGPAFGPGQAGYVAALRAYDQAFARFFQRLEQDGITPANTLFVITADEGDHFVGGPPTPADCDGITLPCNYSVIGEINVNMAGLLATQQGVTTPFQLHADSAPAIYITGNPGRSDPVTRAFERATGKLSAVNPITGKTEQLTQYMADPIEMKLLHMVTADPARTPTFVWFANPDYYIYAGPANCNTPCVQVVPTYAWNHGDIAPDINRTWLGLVGPGVRHLGRNNSIWADHADIRPTMMELLGLKDDYRHDGRVLIEALDDSALPPTVRRSRGLLLQLGQLLKRIDAPVGDLALSTLRISTLALESGSPDNDSTYTRMASQLQLLTAQRNALADELLTILEGAEFGGSGQQAAAKLTPARTATLVAKGNNLLQRARSLTTRRSH
ncbi:hypothetical protein [Thermogemmatispora carboxidivorans]|uniref:hypothetical protein n=1 Tax=Thermogemmatispora carboxidivorans TaxID=1382306 RepID=UPI00069AEF88|nr:hypothetical protein [Thermogemmatispora carboxidivorans]